MRRTDREMDTAFALDVADRCEYAVIAMIDTTGKPYCVPVSPVRIGQNLYFHCAQEGKKADALRKNPDVCVSCVGNTHRLEDSFTTEFESAILTGVADEVMDNAEKTEALRALCQRHTPTNMTNFNEAIARSLQRTAVWRISIKSITGKRKKYDAAGKEMKFGRME